MQADMPTTRTFTPRELEELQTRAVEQFQQQQTQTRKQRQAEGIAAAKARGVRFGRPRIETSPVLIRTLEAWERKEISLQDALRVCHISEATFFRRLRQFRQKRGI